MFKSKLTEMCQKKTWSRPEYEHSREGPAHNLRFTGAVTVNGLTFRTAASSSFTSLKQAYNEAARLAFLHFSASSDPDPNVSSLALKLSHLHLLHPPPSSNPFPSSSSAQSTGISTNNHHHEKCSNLDNEHPINGTTIFPAPQTRGDSLDSLNDIISTEVERHIYKSQLQIYALKKKCTLPTYTYESEGPSHDRRFKSKVTVDEQTFESSGFFHTKKEADNAAAKVAFLSLSADGLHEDIFRDLLLELVRREGFGAPTYATNISGVAHSPIFVSTVTIEGEIFQGIEAKSKKLAEISAAKTAYTTLIERKVHLSPKVTTPICEVQDGPSSLINIFDMNVKAKDITVEERPEKNRVQVCPSLKVGTPSCNVQHGPSSSIETPDMEVNATDIIIKEEPKNNRVKECQSLKVGAASCKVQNGSSSLIKAPTTKENVRDIEIEEQYEKPIATDQTESVEVPVNAKASTQGPSITSPKTGAATKKLESSSAWSVEYLSYSSSELSGHTSDSAGLNFKQTAGMSTLPFKKIMVLPRSPNMTFPRGVNYGKVLPMSNDQWVAVDVNPNMVNKSMPDS